MKEKKICEETVNYDFIKKLSKAFGVSGREKEVREIIREELEPCCDRVCTDPLGGLIAEKNGRDPVLLATGMDEAGFIITGIKKDSGAYLTFDEVGKIKPCSIMSQTVAVGDKKLPGIISRKAVHLLSKEESEKPIDVKDLFIDIGASDENCDEHNISIGDYAEFKSECVRFGNSRITGKAIKRSVCCALLISLLKSDFRRGVTCFFTSRSQVRNVGSKLSLGSVQKSFSEAIVIDCVEADDAKPGCGVAIPNMIGETCADETVVRNLKRTVENVGNLIPLAKKNKESDLANLSVKEEGMRCGELDIPIRNENTASEIVDLRDVYEAHDILANFLAYHIGEA